MTAESENSPQEDQKQVKKRKIGSRIYMSAAIFLAITEVMGIYSDLYTKGYVDINEIPSFLLLTATLSLFVKTSNKLDKNL
jgi:hypothetical protein